MSSLKKNRLYIFIFFSIWMVFYVFDCYASQIISQKEHQALFSKLKLNGFKQKEIEEIFSDERFVLLPEKLWREKPGPINYFSNEFGMFSADSIQQGKAIIRQKTKILNQIERDFSVEKEIIISLWRIESNFGSFLGKQYVFNYLYRLYVFKLKSWAEVELFNFLVLCKKHGYDPLSIKGSWAGCFGYWQFIPSSFLKFAIDGDGDGKIDLFSFTDGAYSAANYLKAHGWKKGTSINQKADKNHVLYYYNRDINYVLAVLVYAKIISNQHVEF